MLFTSDLLKGRFNSELLKGEMGNSREPNSQRAAGAVKNHIRLQESLGPQKQFDIFLSHSSKDVELVLGLKLQLEDLKYSVYIDWIDDPDMDRSRVTKTTAEKLQKRMKQSLSLVYAFTENGSNSKWMPWELGYFDALKSKAAVLPILNSTADARNEQFIGSEYLGIYPYVSITGTTLYVHEAARVWATYSGWLRGEKPSYR